MTNKVEQRQWRVGLAMGFVGTLVAASGLWYYFSGKTNDRIMPFDTSRDLSNAVALVQEDWNWLIDAPEYPLEYVLSEGVPTEYEPHRAGELKTYVIRQGDDLVGFTSFHKKSEYLGRILFMVVNKKYRRQGYAAQLLNFALQELKGMGMRKVELNTRKTNHRARSLYIKHGFEPSHEVGGHIYFYKDLR